MAVRSARRSIGRFPGQTPFTRGPRLGHDALGPQRRLAGGDLLLSALVLGLAPGFLLAVAPFDLALLSPLFLAGLVRPNALGLRLLALLRGDQALSRRRPLLHGHGARRLAVQIVAPIPSTVKQRQQVAIPARMVGQRPAQRGRVEAGQPRDQIGEDADLEGSKIVVVVWKRQGKPFPQDRVNGVDGMLVGLAHDRLNWRVCTFPRHVNQNLGRDVRFPGDLGFLKSCRWALGGGSSGGDRVGFAGFWSGGSERTLLKKAPPPNGGGLRH